MGVPETTLRIEWLSCSEELLKRIAPGGVLDTALCETLRACMDSRSPSLSVVRLASCIIHPNELLFMAGEY